MKPDEPINVIFLVKLYPIIFLLLYFNKAEDLSEKSCARIL